MEVKKHHARSLRAGYNTPCIMGAFSPQIEFQIVPTLPFPSLTAAILQIESRCLYAGNPIIWISPLSSRTAPDEAGDFIGGRLSGVRGILRNYGGTNTGFVL